MAHLPNVQCRSQIWSQKLCKMSWRCGIAAVAALPTLRHDLFIIFFNWYQKWKAHHSFTLVAKFHSSSFNIVRYSPFENFNLTLFLTSYLKSAPSNGMWANFSYRWSKIEKNCHCVLNKKIEPFTPVFYLCLKNLIRYYYYQRRYLSFNSCNDMIIQ